MVIKRELIEKKLYNLKNFLKKIEAMDFGLQKLIEDQDTQDLLVFRFQQAVEICVDIATHIIAGLDLPRKETAKDAVILLGNEKIISEDLASRLGEAVDFRNIVVHHYDDDVFDFEMLFEDYEDNLNDLRQFAREVFTFLEKENSDMQA